MCGGGGEGSGEYSLTGSWVSTYWKCVCVGGGGGGYRGVFTDRELGQHLLEVCVCGWVGGVQENIC